MAVAKISIPNEILTGMEAGASGVIRFDREVMNRLLLEGVDSGTAQPLDMTELKKKAQALLSHGKRSK